LKKLKAYLWLHALRTLKYTFSLINWGIVDFLWMSIYMLAVLAFTSPQKYPEVVPFIFWSIVAFSLMSTPVWTIGNWMSFYVNIGIFEEHELSNVDHKTFLVFRAIPSLPVTLVSALAAALLLYSVTHVNPLRVNNLALLILSLTLIFLMALFYSLIIAFLSLITSTPAPLLDFMNFFLFFAGGIAVPVASLPRPLRILALITPYSHPSEVLRYSVSLKRPYLGLSAELLISALYLLVLIVLVLVIARWALRSVKVRGLKGIGRT
jgi:ABC-2 type transport system permease protein